MQASNRYPPFCDEYPLLEWRTQCKRPYTCMSAIAAAADSLLWGTRPFRASMSSPDDGLDPQLVTERQIDSDCPGAIHQPNSGQALEQRNNSGASVPSCQPRWNFHEINQAETDEDNHHGDVSGLPKYISSEDRNEQVSNGHPPIRA